MTELRLYKVQKRIAEMQNKAKAENGRVKITKKGSKKESKLSQKV
jgi:DNA-binding protein YbaB